LCAAKIFVDFFCATHIYHFAYATNFHPIPILEEGKMLKDFEEFQKTGKFNFDAAVRSFGEMNKGFQAIAAEMTDYSKKAFEDSTRVFEQLAGAKSVEQAVEIQSQYAKKAYDSYMAEMSKIGEMYAGLAKDAYKPVEAAMTKKAV